MQADVNEMYNVMASFWSAVRDVFPEAWGVPATESRLMHSAGIQAMGVLMDRLMPRIPKDQNFDANLRAALTAIRPKCAWTDGEWEGLGMKWNQIQAVPRHIRSLAEYLVQLDYMNAKVE